MLADITNTGPRFITPRDLGFVEEKADETSVSLPTGTASALIHLNDEWIEIDVTQSWFWSEEWQAGEREVDAHIAAGEVEEFDSMDDMFDALNT